MQFSTHIAFRIRVQFLPYSFSTINRLEITALPTLALPPWVTSKPTHKKVNLCFHFLWCFMRFS